MRFQLIRDPVGARREFAKNWKENETVEIPWRDYVKYMMLFMTFSFGVGLLWGMFIEQHFGAALLTLLSP